MKIGDIVFTGNEAVSEKVLRKAMKNTKIKGKAIFKSSSSRRRSTVKTFAPSLRSTTLGYRDARVVSDTVYSISDELVQIDIAVEEGKKYYFGDITFIGNTKYETELLSGILKINRGDIYDSQHLNERVSFDPNGNDVASIT